MKRHWSIFQLLLLALGVLLGTGTARADKPSVIRIAYPGVGVGNRPFVGGDSAATTHLKGLLDEEFKADGIKITWTFLRGAGPATNELYANNLLDFSALGDLPFIVGQASGLKRKVLLAAGVHQRPQRQEGRHLQGYQHSARDRQDPRSQRADRKRRARDQHG
jgi:sulfonate transport system substrate-binding protein